MFRSVNKLTLNGGGTIDGNGEKWWLSQLSLKIVKTQINSYLFKMKLGKDKIYIKIVDLDEI